MVTTITNMKEQFYIMCVQIIIKIVYYKIENQLFLPYFKALILQISFQINVFNFEKK